VPPISATPGKTSHPGAEEKAGKADAIFLGAIGWPQVRQADGTEIAPHLRLRERFQLYAGVRPVKAYPNAPQRLADPRAASIDFVVLRESTEGLFYSAATHKRPQIANDDEVRDTLRITRKTTEKLHDFAFNLDYGDSLFNTQFERTKRREGTGATMCKKGLNKLSPKFDKFQFHGDAPSSNCGRGVWPVLPRFLS